MKYAIIADLHANIGASRAVFADIERAGADAIVCLGDLVGYNARPNECIELLRQHVVRAISGNHDRAAIGAKDTARFGIRARHAIDWTRPLLHAENRDFLRDLPSTLLVDDRFFVVHGALHPEPNDELHLSNLARVEASMQKLASGCFGARVCFFGHTHLPVAFEHSARTGTRRLEGTSLELFPDAYYLVNPGSVGEPRDRDERAAYAMIDSERRVVEFRRVAYDIAATRDESRQRGLLRPDAFLTRSLAALSARFDRSRDLLQARLSRPNR